MTRIELHCHTTASDGAQSPTELVAQARSVGITILAITDHDTVGGLAEARTAATEAGIELLNGCEFACPLPHGELHMLAYLFDEQNAALRAQLAELQADRRTRGQKMVERLNTLGIPVAWERVAAIAGSGAVGRPHIAQALIEGGWATSTDDAFTRLIGTHGPAYVPRSYVSPATVLGLIGDAGGVVSIAHPAHIRDLDGLLEELVPLGLAGLETYYGEYPPDTVARLATLADQYGLVSTGGSDYHGRPIKDHGDLGCRLDIPADTVDRLRARRRQG